MKTKEDWQTLENEIGGCRKCPRLVTWRETVAREKKRAFQDCDYWGKGVPGFGDPNARVLVLGLAPGAHGSNRTGRMFTGDSSGNFLFPALFRAGFSDREFSLNRDDELKLTDLLITAVCRCAPPGNKPEPDEIVNCSGYLERELELLPRLEGIVALGQIAFHEILVRLKKKRPGYIRYEIRPWSALPPRDGSPLAVGVIPSQPSKYPDRPPDLGHVRPYLEHCPGIA